MIYLLDANVISELARREPDPRVTAWLDAVPDEALAISVLTLGELRKGVEMNPVGGRKRALLVWLEADLPDWFEDRALPIDAAVADRWGRLVAAARRAVPAIDGLLAATALRHDLRLVTRNVLDFAFPGLEVVDPWAD